MPPPPLQSQNFLIILTLEILLFIQELLTLGYLISEAVKKALLDLATTSTTPTSSEIPGSSLRLPSHDVNRTPTRSQSSLTCTTTRSSTSSTGCVRFHGRNSQQTINTPISTVHSNRTPRNSLPTASSEHTHPSALCRRRTTRRRCHHQVPPLDPWTEPWPEPKEWLSVPNHP